MHVSCYPLCVYLTPAHAVLTHAICVGHMLTLEKHTVCVKHVHFHVHAVSFTHLLSMCQQLSFSLVMPMHSTKRLMHMPIQPPAFQIEAHARVPFKHQHLTCTQACQNIYSLSVSVSLYLCACLSLHPYVSYTHIHE